MHKSTVLFGLMCLCWASLCSAQPTRAQYLFIAASVVPETNQNQNAVPVSEQEHYDAVISLCNYVYVYGNPDSSIFNVIYPASAAGFYFNAAVPDGDSGGITLLDAPENGVVVPNPDVSGTYIYQPNKGYVGLDKVTFSVEANGKRFKVIQSVIVSTDAPDAKNTPAEQKACPLVIIKEPSKDPKQAVPDNKGAGLNYMLLPSSPRRLG